MFVVILADEAVAARIAEDELLDMRLEELGDPAGEVGLFEHEALVGGGNVLDMLHQEGRLGGEAPPFEFGALIVEVPEDALFGVGIQTEPCYRCVIHNKPLVVVDVINNLADAWRIRICSFIESLNCSVLQVVRFSTYQEATTVGRFFYVRFEFWFHKVFSPSCLSLRR